MEEIFYLNIYGDFVTVVYVRHTEFSPIQVACSLRRLASTNWGQSLLLMLHIYPILQLFSTTRQEDLLILSLYRTKKIQKWLNYYSAVYSKRRSKYMNVQSKTNVQYVIRNDNSSRRTLSTCFFLNHRGWTHYTISKVIFQSL